MQKLTWSRKAWATGSFCHIASTHFVEEQGLFCYKWINNLECSI
jgi:hypothetical protein